MSPDENTGSSTPQRASAHAVQALYRERDALSAVHTTLSDENSALNESAAAALEAAVVAKNDALAALAERRSAREAVLGDAALKEAVLCKVTDAQLQTEALNLVDELKHLGKACQQLNQRNGRLVNGLRDMTTGALAVLRGEPTVKLYGQSGESAENLGGRELGTA